MGEKLVFDYYYGNEAEQFSFLRVPKLLITDKRFSKLSSDAKLLYGLLLDRMSLSVKNGWFDDGNRAYIIYAIDDIAEDLNCSHDKAVRVMKELDSNSGIGLVEKIRRGLGKPDIIYVMNFALQTTPEDEKELANPQESTEVLKQDFCKSENKTSGSLKTRLLEVTKSDFCESENKTSASLKIRPPEVLKSDSNNTNINNTDFSDTNRSINQSMTQPIQLSLVHDGLMDGYNECIESIKKQIGYKELMMQDRVHEQFYNALIGLMADIYLSDEERIRIGKEYRLSEQVKERFKQINMFTVQYVKDSFYSIYDKIQNVRGYLLSALYNAPVTIDAYYVNLVHSDMEQG